MEGHLPVVGKGDQKLDARLGGRVDDLVERSQVNAGLAVVPSLKHDFGGAGALAAVLGLAGRVVRDVLVVEAPRAEDVQAGLLGRREAELDVGLVLGPGSASGRVVGALVARGRTGPRSRC